MADNGNSVPKLDSARDIVSGSNQGTSQSASVDAKGKGSNLPPADHITALGVDRNTHRDIDVTIGPVEIKGYVDTASYEVGVEPKILGISLGSYYGNLRKSLEIGVGGSGVAKESIKLYLKRNAVWVHCVVTPWGTPTFDKDQEILGASVMSK